MNFNSATHAEIEEPYTPVNKDLYPDRYAAWKDSIWSSIKSWGRPLDYQQNFTLSYQLPINLLPVFDWVRADATYSATYNWVRGTSLENGMSLGNTIANNRQLTVNGDFDLVRLYNHIPFLKKANERFDRMQSQSLQQRKREQQQKKDEQQRQQREMQKVRAEAVKSGKDPEEAVAQWKKQQQEAEEKKKQLPRNKRAFEKEIVLRPDTTIDISHGRKSRRLEVTAHTADGKVYKLKYKRLDDNRIRIRNKVDSATTLKLSVVARPTLDDQNWYKTAQTLSRFAMMVRSVSFTYRNNYSLALPGFMPTIGNAFGQTRGSHVLSPGLDFAFGLVEDGYIDRAQRHGWLLNNDSVATPATTQSTEDVQMRVMVEPVKNLKIDLNAARMQTRARSIQYMYVGNPTTQTGSLTMTTLSIGTSFESMGSATNGFQSKSFERFCASLAGFRQRVEDRYVGTVYPTGTTLAGGTFNAANGSVNPYSADVMVPAFLSTYTSMSKGLSIFPSLMKMLPNWTVRYSGLSRLPWFRDHFKSVNINHSYKSIYAVGAYQSYSTFVQLLNPDMGFISDATTGGPIPNSMYNVSMVSINESFSPLLGVDVTFLNDLTTRLEYRQTRSLALSMTSVQLNEALSRDWVLGMGYKLNNFNFFGLVGSRKVKTRSKAKAQPETITPTSRSTNHALNLRLDVSWRRQAAITRDIATVSSTATSGNSAFKFAFSAEYTLSRLLSMSFYLDRQTNTPLLSSSSYPTTTQDFGLSVKFSLTR